MSNQRRIKVGDLLEVQTSRGLAYVQYIGKHPEYGEVIRVLPRQRERRTADSLESLAEPGGYLAFYSARAAVVRGFAKIVDSYPIPKEVEIPKNLRRPGARGGSGEILSWIVECDGQETVRKELTETERRLPIAAIWDHEVLILRIAEGWSPDQEG